MRVECPCSEQHDGRICPDQATFIETEAVQEVARRLDLSDQANSFLATQHRRYSADGGLSGCIIPGMVAVGAAGIAVLFLYLQQVITTVVLSSWGLFLLGRQATGDPVKWTALTLFIAGSILDLVWG